MDLYEIWRDDGGRQNQEYVILVAPPMILLNPSPAPLIFSLCDQDAELFPGTSTYAIIKVQQNPPMCMSCHTSSNNVE